MPFPPPVVRLAGGALGSLERIGQSAASRRALLFDLDFSSPGFDAVRFIGGMARIGHNGLVGMRYHAHGPDWAELALDQSEALLGENGIVANGPILTTVDMALSVAVWLKAGRFRPHATLDMRVDWMRVAEAGRTLYVRGDCHDRAGTVSFVRGAVHDGDPARAVAHVMGSYILT